MVEITTTSCSVKTSFPKMKMKYRGQRSFEGRAFGVGSLLPRWDVAFKKTLQSAFLQVCSTGVALKFSSGRNVPEVAAVV